MTIFKRIQELKTEIKEIPVLNKEDGQTLRAEVTDNGTIRISGGVSEARISAQYFYMTVDELEALLKWYQDIASK